MNVEIIRIDGSREQQHIPHKSGAISAIQKFIGAEMCDTVNLRDGRVMLVDDTGMVDGKPVNAEATKLYHGLCHPGVLHPICGDVAIAIDADFE
jgi:hypothetical protein